MEFRDKKLPAEAAALMSTWPISGVKPFTLVMAPAYVLMKRNGKLVSVKEPLDYFTPEELTKYASFEFLYFPQFMTLTEEFRQAAREVRELLSWRPRTDIAPGADGMSMLQIPPASFEVADAVLRKIGPLWAKDAAIEPFFAGAFADELCGAWPVEGLRATRDRDIATYENAVFLACWAVFLALHLGYCELSFLQTLRTRVFEESAGLRASASRVSEVDELIDAARASLADKTLGTIRGDFFVSRGSRASRKLASRLARVNPGMIRADRVIPSIHGPRGFVDA